MATSVKFGEQDAASVEFVSDTEVVATTPEGVEGAVDVTVTTSGGTATAEGAFTYGAVQTQSARRKR